MKTDPDEENPLDNLFFRTSVTVDEAVAMLLGWLSGPVRFSSVGDNLTDEEREILDNATFSLAEEIELRSDRLDEEFSDAKARQLPNEVIEDKRIAIKDFRAEVIRANVYLCAINDELSKGNSSDLRIDREISHPRSAYITINSLDQWAQSKYDLTILTPQTSRPTSRNPPTQQRADDGPWRVKDSKDPEPLQPWYTPARYFARSLVRADSTLLTKKPILAKKVADSLANARIFKRGGELPLDPGTVKKALAKVKLS